MSKPHDTQPDPIPNASTPVWELVIADMRARDHVGRQRYGVPLQAGNGRDALKDAYEEALDLAVYLRQAIAERDGDVPILRRVGDLSRGTRVRVRDPRGVFTIWGTGHGGNVFLDGRDGDLLYMSPDDLVEVVATGKARALADDVPGGE